MNPVELHWKRLHRKALLPKKQTGFASGYDLHACIDKPIELNTMPQLIPTGIAVETPPNIDLQIRPRSGLFSKGVIGTIGTIDADYRGELYVALYCLPNLGKFIISNGDRIAQLVITTLTEVKWTEVEELSKTERGSGGHGSTGING
ncbi:MAG: dUTP diphosphatase [Dehalococcoidia bacterium]|nr:dUTP diphosphatase [Dehalococcoidia bacterium]